MADLLIKNGTIIDGTGQPRYQADLVIQGDRITQIGDLATAEAKQTLDATGKVVAPGFVDVHNHSDAWLLKKANFTPKTSQGFTTEVIMADGISYAPVNEHTLPEWIHYLRALNGLRFEDYRGWQSLADYMALLDGTTAQNSITHIPYANVRSMACGFGRQVPDDYQMRQILSEIEKGMEEGAVGLSTGMDYIVQCFSSTDELVEACRAMAPYQGLYVTHMRYKKGIMPALQEAVEIGKRAGAPVHISHLKGTSPEVSDEILSYIDQVARQEVDFSFDVYPYLPGSTMLSYILPYEVWEDGSLAATAKLTDPVIRAKVAANLAGSGLEKMVLSWVASKENAHHQGKRLADYIDEMGLPPEDAVCNLLIEENLAVLMVAHHGDDALIEPFLSHDCYMMGSDGIYQEDGIVHPRHYGSAVRVLGPCVREKQWLSLEAAVRKLSGYPAERFGLKNRGRLETGKFADVVIFDAATVGDAATYTDPHQYANGIAHVVVNGTPIIEDGVPADIKAGTLPGRALRFGQ
ncbi:MAG: D-aminoacylase [Chloroflexota bacterium]